MTLIVVLSSMLTWAQHFPVGLVSVQDSMRSVQVGFLSSVVVDKGKGFQLSGFSNMSAVPFYGFQLSGISNISRGLVKGMQLSALLNVSSAYMRGLQFASVNYADSLNGPQLGVVNVARSHPKGWQIGVVNITRDTIAHKIGLVNINPKTTIDYMLYGGTATKGNFAVRFRNRSTYSLLGVGTHFMGLDEKFSGALFYRLGQYFNLSPKWSLSGDLGFYHIETFQQHSREKPERLYSLQVRFNVDYQLSGQLGLFASAGWGETRFYYKNAKYRSRPLVEMGISIRQPRISHSQLATPKSSVYVLNESLLAQRQKKRYWLAAGEVFAINAGVHFFDRFVMKEDFAETTFRSIKHNFEAGFVWDNDQFSTNMFAHPYHGNLYFNSARSNGLNFWESAPYALAGSLMWELFGETEPPALNDVIATTVGGIAIGELSHRISNLFLDDSSRGFKRFLREAGSTVINPLRGMNRFLNGNAWRVRHEQNKYHDYSLLPLDISITAGDRYLADNGALFRGEHNPFVNFYIGYGNSVDGEKHTTPYDFFDAEVTFGLSKNQPLINAVHITGRLWSMPILDKKDMVGEFGIYQYFNYFDSRPVKDGTDLTPYRISEAAAFGPGFIFSFPQVGVLSRLEQCVFLSGILLGGTKSDYFSIIDRDYNMGSGFSIKTKTHLDFSHFGSLILHAKYFRIFTWKGYEAKDMNHVKDLHYLDVQGDRGNAALLVVNPVIEIDMNRLWSISFSGSFFARKTHYKYYDDVAANTFEARLGLTCHL